MPEKSEQSTATDSPEARLRLARERSGKTAEQVASLAGMNLPAYYDLESCSDEVTMAISLRELKRVCDVLLTTPRSLFDGGPQREESRVSPDMLVEKIRQHLQHTRMSLPEIENKIGFEIAQCLERTEAIEDWNVDCLRAVCEEVGADWLAALP